MTDSDYLKVALDQGIISIDSIKAQIEVIKRKETLEKHPYQIWQGRDDAWYTYLKIDGKRVQKRRKSRIELEDLIVEYYRDQEKSGDYITFRQEFENWIAQKVEWKEIDQSTEIRYRSDFARFFPEGCEFADTDVRHINGWMIETFIKKTVVEMSLTAKRYAGLKLIINGVLKYAKKLEHTTFSVGTFFADFDISDKIFAKPSEESKFIFNREERRKIYKYCLKNPDIRNLAIALQCLTGLRIGELSTLKIGDLISEDQLFIHRTEHKYLNENRKQCIGVKEEAKQGHNGVIHIPPEARRIINQAYMQTHDDEYLFSENGKRLTSRQLGYRLEKICGYVEIKYRSSHKIRKTYASILRAEHVDATAIQNQMRHKQLSTTLDHYCFDVEDEEERNKAIDAAIAIS